MYSRFDNVENTGNAAVDDMAEGMHDALFSFATFVTLFQALIGFIAVSIVLYFIPDRIFAEPITA